MAIGPPSVIKFGCWLPFIGLVVVEACNAGVAKGLWWCMGAAIWCELTPSP